jgi:methanethiol S-methyltransferase
LEERELVAALGNRYRDYCRHVPMLIPLPRRHTAETVGQN